MKKTVQVARISVFIKSLVFILGMALTLVAGPLRPSGHIDLSGDWKFSTNDDPAFAKAKANDSSWKTIRLPGFWQQQGFENHHGFAWARKSVTLAAGKPLPSALRFEGLFDEAEVFINGQSAGLARGAIGMNANLFPIPEPVLVDVSKFFKVGDNVIALRFFDHPSTGEWIWRGSPFPPAKGLAGIEKKIALETAPEVFVQDVFVRLLEKAVPESKYRFEVAVQNKSGNPAEIKISLNAGGQNVIKKATVHAGLQSVPVELSSRPAFGNKTYSLTLESSAGTDAVAGNWHSVIVEQRGGKIFVNGEVFIVKGFNGHFLWGDDIVKELAELLMDINVNFLRPAQGTHLWFKEYEKYSSAMILPVVSGYFSCKNIEEWKKPVAGKTFTHEDSATNELPSFIRSAAESPLLFGWNTLNEIETHNKPESEKALVSLLEKMRTEIRRFDGYERPNTYANLMWDTQRITDAQDLLAFNYYVDPDVFDFNKVKTLSGERPFVFTETDLPSGYWKPPFWNNTPLHIAYQSKLYTKMLAAGGSGVMMYSGLFDYHNRHIGLLGGDWRKPAPRLSDLKVNPEYRDFIRWLYRDFDIEVKNEGGKLKVKVANLMPYALMGLKLVGSKGTSEEIAVIPPGGNAVLQLSAGETAVRALYTTHSGLNHNTGVELFKTYQVPAVDLGEAQQGLSRKVYAFSETLTLNSVVSPAFASSEKSKADAVNSLTYMEGVSRNSKASSPQIVVDPTEGSAARLQYSFGADSFRNDWVRYSLKSPVADFTGWDGLAIRIKNDGKIKRVNVVVFDEAGKPADIWSVPPLFEKDWQTVTFFFKNKEQLRENSTAQIDQLNLKTVKTIRLQIDDYLVKEELLPSDQERTQTVGDGEIFVGEIALVKLKK